MPRPPRAPTTTNRLPGILRPRDLAQLGIPRSRVRTLVRRGELHRIGRGLYQLDRAPPTEHETIALVCKRVPQAVVCLLSALRVHDIGTQAPRDVWIALDRKARKPKFEDVPVRIVRFSGRMLRYAVLDGNIGGVPIRITSPARTVVDCFRYRNKIGIDVALEALRDALSRKLATIDEIHRVADVCRALTVVRPYLESAAAS